MPQSGKLMPNLDQNSTKLLNLTVLQRIDPFVEEILITSAHVTFYEFNVDTSQWSRKDVEGSLFVVKRNTQPRFQFIVMNRRNTDNLVENLLEDFEFEVQVPYLLYRNAAQEVNGIWFYNARECEEVANLFSRILNAYSKVPTKSKLSSKSEFEELEAVPSMAAMDGPLEPSSTTTLHVTDAHDDPSFVNFFSTALTIGNASSATISGQPYNSQSVTPPSHPPQGGVPTTIATVQTPPPPLSSSTPLMSLLDNPERNGDIKWSTNLVKPSTFFNSPSSAPLMMPPVSSSLPTAPPLHSSGSLQRPYGAPLLQPFPPPNPPPSLTPSAAPTPSHVPAITRGKIREAFSVLVQMNVNSTHLSNTPIHKSLQTTSTLKEDQFIDMVYQAMLNAHSS